MGKMRIYVIFCLCITGLALPLMPESLLEQNTSAASFLQQNVPPDTRIWQVLPSRALVAGQSFSLYTSPPSEYVVYGHRDYGINLDWTRNRPQSDNFTFERASGEGGPIKYGDVLALKESRGGYIYYKKRDYGINLEFSSQPVYEWEVRGGNIGTPVVERNWGDSASNISDVMFSLYNRRVDC